MAVVFWNESGLTDFSYLNVKRKIVNVEWLDDSKSNITKEGKTTKNKEKRLKT